MSWCYKSQVCKGIILSDSRHAMNCELRSSQFMEVLLPWYLTLPENHLFLWDYGYKITIMVYLRNNNSFKFLLFFSGSSLCFPECNFLLRRKIRNMLAVWLTILCPIFSYYIHEAKPKWHLRHAGAYFLCYTLYII
jgi:hypothetical protein